MSANSQNCAKNVTWKYETPHSCKKQTRASSTQSSSKIPGCFLSSSAVNFTDMFCGLSLTTVSSSLDVSAVCQTPIADLPGARAIHRNLTSGVARRIGEAGTDGLRQALGGPHVGVVEESTARALPGRKLIQKRSEPAAVSAAAVRKSDR